tara:strand:+ start:411 stop:656 length:246 start_codon:yes stop_codon:yes gene_type:complete
MDAVAICTTWPKKGRRFFYSCAPMPGRVLIGNQWVAEIDGDIVPVGEHSSPEAALLAARYLACNDDDVTALISPDGAQRYI